MLGISSLMWSRPQVPSDRLGYPHIHHATVAPADSFFMAGQHSMQGPVLGGPWLSFLTQQLAQQFESELAGRVSQIIKIDFSVS